MLLLSTIFNPKRVRHSTFYSNASSKTQCLQTLFKSGFVPTLKSINHFLRVLYQSHRFNYVIHFISQMNANQIKGNSKTHSILTWALLKSHKYDELEQILKTQMAAASNFHRNRLWNLLIRGLCLDKQDPEKALWVLRDCLRNHGILPSSFTFCVLIHKFSSLGLMNETVQILEIMSDENVNYPFDNFVCSSVISGFCNIGKPELALKFYENAKELGNLKPNLVTYTALTSALSKLHRVNEVKDLVCKMENENLAFDVVFYSCWICGYVAEGLLLDVFKRNREMIQKGIRPDIVSFTVLIHGLSKSGNVEKAFGVLDRMRKSGLEPSSVTYTVIMLGFCKKGKLEEAFSLFEMIKGLEIEVDEFMYATLIDGCCRKGDFSRVFGLLDEMETRGIKPSIVTYNTVINGLCKLGRTSEADRLSKDLHGDVITYSTLLHGYVQERNIDGIFETKTRLEDAGISLDVVMCNVMVKALFMVGAFEDAYILYKRMPEIGLVADSVTYHTMINGYCNISRIDEALEIFDEFKSASCDSMAVYNGILKTLCREGLVEKACEVFIELNPKVLSLDVGVYKKLIRTIFEQKGAAGLCEVLRGMENLERDVYDVICNDAIRFLCKRGFSETAIELCSRMRKTRSFLETKTYYLLIKALNSEGKTWISLPILGNFLKEYGLAEPIVKQTIADFRGTKFNLSTSEKMEDKFLTCVVPDTVFKVLVREGRFFDAYNLVMKSGSNLLPGDVFDYSILICGLCKGGRMIEALDICIYAQTNGIKLNIVSYNIVIKGLCLQSCLIEAFRLFDSLERIGLIPTVITYGTLIDSLCREGYLEDARQLFDQMTSKGLEPNTHICNSMIDGYIRIGQIEEANKLLRDMETEVFSPDEFSVSSAIKAYCRNGDMEGALSSFFEFKNKNISPDFLGFLYLIRGLCAKGRMEEARDILLEMVQSRTAMELINKVDTEIETESIESTLTLLCEEGRILEAYAVLNEVGSIFFSAQRRSIDYSQPHKLHINDKKFVDVVRSGTFDVNTIENMKYEDREKRPHFEDFNFYYPILSSLCSEGNIREATQLAKEVICNLDRG
ncbi:pentatricopeptide repeat-containing protein At5g57250, mitochondrial [Cucurbita pepo subsp. pepo]|uniref:pentatricopeptide repeat-containing protein At5g57250, mitochondrial n=1 Tax=Cucurbita pepo subsp. pepo TaxID=3664 RepID=UPI000C9DA3E3|nr:pentatricopeptide repeat-containing protein At5g57250, mitochondrial [Cucurbita pepo subsp. pepo]XP_023537112.1 pentatricopeptide repeat-containing protein At5g57250, mitochondrial [Cucurbita pepo subsp. pepo]XP_023537113.1 pentatricopeptide repeat-containing protein At5g57250, mitochondrial [Cucurbita pepo subsp. pepo]